MTRETTEQAERAERIAWTLRNIESAEAKARHGHPATVTVALADLRAILAALDPRAERIAAEFDGDPAVWTADGKPRRAETTIRSYRAARGQGGIVHVRSDDAGPIEWTLDGYADLWYVRDIARVRRAIRNGEYVPVAPVDTFDYGLREDPR